MDKLSESQQASISKMSDERLRSKLSKAGYKSEILIQFTRVDLMKAMAEVMIAEEEQGEAAAQVEEEQDVEEAAMEKIDEGTMSIEERRIVLEEKWLLMEERKWKAEMELRKSETEKERQKERMKMDLKARELELKRMTVEKEQSSKESTANKLKLWGDGLRNTISKMPTEPIEVVSWFMALEKLFNQLEVPAELRSVLLRPYLNERVKALLARCDLEKTGDYNAIKEFLLREMRLSRSIYLEKFNSLARDASETFQQFATRLMSLFDLYLESRKVGNSYEKLFDLIIYDRIKSVLPPFLSRHILALESSAG